MWLQRQKQLHRDVLEQLSLVSEFSSQLVDGIAVNESPQILRLMAFLAVNAAILQANDSAGK